MLFWIWIILIVAGIIGWIVCNRFDDFGDFIWTYAVPLVVGCIGAFVAGFVLILTYAGLSGQVVKNQTRYDMLVYQYENNVYENDNDLGKRELIEDIQKWNEDVAYYKAVDKDFWIGVFIPKEYTQFEFIELSEDNCDD